MSTSQRLNKEVKQIIIGNALKRNNSIIKFQEIFKEEAAFAEKVRVIANGGQKGLTILEQARTNVLNEIERLQKSKIITTASDIADGMENFLFHSGIAVNMGGHALSLSFNPIGRSSVFFYFYHNLGLADVYPDLTEDEISEKMKAVKKVTQSFSYGYHKDNRYVFKQDSAIYKEFKTIKAKANAIYAEYTDLRHDLAALLDGVASTKKLMEIWPEAKELIPWDYYQPTYNYMPSISTKSLNERLKL